jgi:hypothetical protein
MLETVYLMLRLIEKGLGWFESKLEKWSKKNEHWLVQYIYAEVMRVRGEYIITIKNKEKKKNESRNSKK